MCQTMDRIGVATRQEEDQLPSSPHAPGRLCQRLVQTIYQSSLDYR